MIAIAFIQYAEENAAAAEIAKAARAEFRKHVKARFDRGVELGELPDDTDTLTLARFVLSVIQGMSIQANDNATEDDLLRLVDLALAAWPGLRPDVKPGGNGTLAGNDLTP